MGIITLALAVLASFLQPGSVYADHPNTNKTGTISLPAGEGSPAVVYSGTVPSGSGGTSASNCVDNVNAWFYTLHLVSPTANYTATHDTKLTVQIEWVPVSGNATTQDIALFLTDSTGKQIASSDGGTPKETVVVDNLYTGTFSIIACAFAVALPQPFRGQATLISTLKVGSVPLPPPENGDRGIRFSATTIVDPQRSAGEPSLRITKKDDIYACGPAGASGTADYIQKSEDRGDTFRILGTPPVGRIASGGGGDCDISVGTQPNDQGEYTLAYTGLEALVNFSVSRSRDAGRSFVGTNTSESPVGVDRQWMETSGKEEVYLGYHGLAFGYQMQRSTDGGLTYGPTTIVADSIDTPGPVRIDENASHNPLFNPAVPDVNDEIIYAIYTNGDGVFVSRSYNEGVTWTGPYTVARGFNANNLFASLGIDTAGNLYAAWTEKGSYNTYYAYSLRPASGPGGAGETWSTKRLVNRSPVNSTVMPWIEAGDPGRIVVTYYGSQSDGNFELGSFRGYWDVYVSTSFNALDAPDANGNVPFALTKATTHPVHWDSICVSGVGCTASGGDRTLLDFFQTRLDPRGGIHVVFNQSNKVPGAPAGRQRIVGYIKQIAGPGLYASQTPTVDARAVLRSASSDPLGDAVFPFSAFGSPPPVRSNIDAMDITNLALVPTCTGGGEPGTFEIRLSLKDLSDAALTQALADQTARGSSAQSLLWVVRWFSGTDPVAAVAKWTPSGFRFGLDNSLKNVSVSATATNEIYPGSDKVITGTRLLTNTLVMTVKPSDFNALDLPASPALTPTIRTATVGDRMFDVTAFTFGNASANPESQTYLNQGDSTAPFDYPIGALGCYWMPLIRRN